MVENEKSDLTKFESVPVTQKYVDGKMGVWNFVDGQLALQRQSFVFTNSKTQEQTDMPFSTVTHLIIAGNRQIIFDFNNLHYVYELTPETDQGLPSSTSGRVKSSATALLGVVGIVAYTGRVAKTLTATAIILDAWKQHLQGKIDFKVYSVTPEDKISLYFVAILTGIIGFPLLVFSSITLISNAFTNPSALSSQLLGLVMLLIIIVPCVTCSVLSIRQIRRAP